MCVLCALWLGVCVGMVLLLLFYFMIFPLLSNKLNSLQLVYVALSVIGQFDYCSQALGLIYSSMIE